MNSIFLQFLVFAPTKIKLVPRTPYQTFAILPPRKHPIHYPRRYCHCHCHLLESPRIATFSGVVRISLDNTASQ